MASLSFPSLPKTLSSSSLAKPTFSTRKTQFRITAAKAQPQPATGSAKATMYELLSVPGTAGQEEIKAAYRRQARRWHPDACPPSGDRSFFAEQFMRVRDAYEILSDPDRRQDYDLALRIGAAVPGNLSAAFAGGAVFRGGRPRAPAGGSGGFRSWESQLEGLKNRAARPGTWGSNMRSAHAS